MTILFNVVENLNKIDGISGHRKLPHFMKAINDKSPEVRLAIFNYEYYKDIGDEVVKNILPIALKDKDNRVRMSAINSMVVSYVTPRGRAEEIRPFLEGNKEIMEILVRIYENKNEEKELRDQAYWGLGLIGWKGWLQEIINKFNSKDAKERLYAVYELREMEGKEIEVLLLKALEDKEANVRRAVVIGYDPEPEGAGRYRKYSSTNILFAALKNKDEEVRTKALDVLRYFYKFTSSDEIIKFFNTNYGK